MNIVTWIASAALAGACIGGTFGYRVGARGLSEVSEALASVRRELGAQAGQFERAKQALAGQADEAVASHRRVVEQLQARYEQDEQRLKAGNVEARHRIGVLDERIATIDRERAALGRPANSVADAASGAERLAALEEARKSASIERDGVACLVTAVPTSQLAALRSD